MVTYLEKQEVFLLDRVNVERAEVEVPPIFLEQNVEVVEGHRRENLGHDAIVDSLVQQLELELFNSGQKGEHGSR